jgi:hypothetical protein
LREINLVGMGDVDFASINREQFAGFLLRHENRLTPVVSAHANVWLGGARPRKILPAKHESVD